MIYRDYKGKGWGLKKKYKRVYKSYRSMLSGKDYWRRRGYRCGKGFKWNNKYMFYCYK